MASLVRGRSGSRYRVFRDVVRLVLSCTGFNRVGCNRRPLSSRHIRAMFDLVSRVSTTLVDQSNGRELGTIGVMVIEY